jgi:hypothetical protein
MVGNEPKYEANLKGSGKWLVASGSTENRSQESEVGRQKGRFTNEAGMSFIFCEIGSAGPLTSPELKGSGE